MPENPEQKSPMPGTEGMSREARDMAVAIAKDVIKQIRDLTNPLRIINCGEYLSGTLGTPIDHFKDLKDYVDIAQSRCVVCMLGGCMLSKARLYDAVPIGGFSFSTGSLDRLYAAREDTESALNGIFSPDQLDLLECAFECNSFMGSSEDDELSRGAAKFGKRHGDPAERAVAIMENVIANSGVFVVEPVSEDEDGED